MTNTHDDGGPAFPVPPDHAISTGDPRDGMAVCAAGTGMSLRDWFAGMALQGYNANREQSANMTHEQAAGNAYRDADAMIASRKEGGR